MTHTTLDAPELSRHLQRLALHIASARDTGQLCALLWQLNTVLHADAAVFLSLKKNDPSFQSYQYVLACPLAWSQAYDKHRWYANDPCLLYAMVNTEPRLMADLAFHSRGQKRLRQAARRAGYHGGLVVPVHSPEGRSRMGLLYLLSTHPRHFNHDSLAQIGWMLRGLTGQLLDWWIRQERAEWRAQLALQAPDIELLRLTHEGYTSKDIAHAWQRSKAAIDQRLYRTTRQFGTHSRKAAAQLAYQLGLF
jgi:DNA-binding CsgD family transcriptional regulator